MIHPAQMKRGKVEKGVGNATTDQTQVHFEDGPNIARPEKHCPIKTGGQGMLPESIVSATCSTTELLGKVLDVYCQYTRIVLVYFIYRWNYSISFWNQNLNFIFFKGFQTTPLFNLLLLCLSLGLFGFFFRVLIHPFIRRRGTYFKCQNINRL